MKKGTIVLVQFPFTNFTSSKRRPALILSANNELKKDVIVAFISSILPQYFLASDIILTETQKSFTETGLHKSSVVKLDKVMTIDIDLITGELGKISDELIVEVNQKIKIIFDL